MAERHGSMGSDIYTVLVMVALVILLIGIGFLLYRSDQLQLGNPFSSSIQGMIQPLFHTLM